MFKTLLICTFMLAFQQYVGGSPSGGPGAGPPPDGREPLPPNGSQDELPQGMELVCGKGVIPIFFDERCCGDVSYTMGHVSALMKFYKDCAVEPQDKSLNIPEAQWTFLECLVEKSVVSEEITTKAFVNMMGGTLDDSTKSKILQIVEKQTGAAKTDKILLLKNLWENYFIAENNVCNENANKSAEVVPLIAFGSSKAPPVMYLPILLRDIAVCQYKFIATYRATNISRVEHLSFLCLLTVPGLASESELQSKSYDYETLVNLLMPKYLSQGSRDKFMKAILEVVKFRLPNLGATPSSEDITKEILEAHNAELQTTPEADQKFVANGIVLSDIAIAVQKSLTSKGKLAEF